MSTTSLTFLRYPGGKQRQIDSFAYLLPSRHAIANSYIEPFVGGGSVFFHLYPRRAILSDINPELVDLFIGIRDHPEEVWEIYRSVPETKSAYYAVRGIRPSIMDLPYRAARVLYLNRTCFKGMWRHNAKGDFNIGYGGQDRRWCITLENLQEISERLRNTIIMCSDFQDIIESSRKGDYLFLDPPYRPGNREQVHDHYRFGSFQFVDQIRLAKTLRAATRRGVHWAMTNSSHPDILDLYYGCYVSPLEKGTGNQIGHVISSSNEVVIRNYEEAMA